MVNAQQQHVVQKTEEKGPTNKIMKRSKRVENNSLLDPHVNILRQKALQKRTSILKFV